jgi:hypothetical protein
MWLCFPPLPHPQGLPHLTDWKVPERGSSPVGRKEGLVPSLTPPAEAAGS